MSNDTQAPQNPEIDVNDLPDYRAVTLHPVAPGYLPCTLLGSGASWLIALLVALALTQLPPEAELSAGPMPVLIVVTAGTLSLLRIWLDARRRGWAVREHDLIYRSGVLWRRTTILPFARIQHVESVSGPLERRFDLVRLKCFTAGGSGGDLVIRGLDVERARRVRAHLLGRIREDAEASETDER